MSENSDREQWAQIPGTPELWVSDAGQIATLRDGGGFDILAQRANQFGERFVQFKAEGKKTKGVRFVAAMVLVAFGQPRPGSRGVGFRDNDPSNCKLANLAWVFRGQTRVVDLKERRCLGTRCNVMFMSHGPGNRLCPACADRIGKITLSGLEGTEESSDLPDEMLFGTGGNPHR